jgi:DNA polymerase (family 10)
VRVQNADVAGVLDEIADLLEIQGENVFRVRAYRNAARTLRDLSTEIASLLAGGQDITELPGIGKDLGAKIADIVRTGSTAKLQELKAKVPPGLTALLKVPSLGPQRVKVLHDKLRIDGVDDLYRAAKAGKIRELPGFAEKTEQHILQALEEHLQKKGQRFLLAEAAHVAQSLADYLGAAPGVKEVVAAGSLRRAKETVGDLDLLVIAESGSPVMDRFVAYREVKEIVSQGTTRSTVILQSGLQVDLRVVPEESFGAALHYFTGSKAHNIAVRRLGQQKGLKVNEYGIFRGDEIVAGDTEQSVFQAAGLPYIAPELREDRGEVEAALAGKLPALVQLSDLKGDLHCHTTASDGRATLRKMAEAARKMGLDYLAVTDHSGHLYTEKTKTSALGRYIEAVRRLDQELSGFTLLVGLEVEILEDGRLGVPDEVLAELDLVVGAVHSHFDLPRQQQTSRLLRAMDHPHFSLLAHPTARQLSERPPMELEITRVVRHAKARGCFLEVNSQPKRLDLGDIHCQLAKEEGVLLAIDSDAHGPEGLANLQWGVGQARRGWLEKWEVLNTRPIDELRPLLARTM